MTVNELIKQIKNIEDKGEEIVVETQYDKDLLNIVKLGGMLKIKEIKEILKEYDDGLNVEFVYDNNLKYEVVQMLTNDGLLIAINTKNINKNIILIERNVFYVRRNGA